MFFSFGNANSLKKGKLLIQTSFTPLKISILLLVKGLGKYI